jgi:hypothetical protein
MFPAAFLALLAPQRRPAPGGGRLRRAAGDGPVPFTQVGVPILFSAFGVIPG